MAATTPVARRAFRAIPRPRPAVPNAAPKSVTAETSERVVPVATVAIDRHLKNVIARLTGPSPSRPSLQEPGARAASSSGEPIRPVAELAATIVTGQHLQSCGPKVAGANEKGPKVTRPKGRLKALTPLSQDPMARSTGTGQLVETNKALVRPAPLKQRALPPSARVLLALQVGRQAALEIRGQMPTTADGVLIVARPKAIASWLKAC